MKDRLGTRWPWPLALLMLTAVTTTMAHGPAYAGTLLAILGAHEMGHYLTARRFRVPASLPFFIPLPPLPAFHLGTLGAVIRMDGQQANRRQLLAIGAAGPISGFIVAVPAMIIGLRLSQPAPTEAGSDLLFFGSSFLSYGIERWLAPEVGPGHELIADPVYIAAWAGFLVTALNLLPMGQLDGGHVLHAAFPRHSARVARAVHRLLVVMGLGGLAVVAIEAVDLSWAHRVAFLRAWLSPGLLLWAVLAGWMGLRHPPIPGPDIPLRSRDRALVGVCAAILLACFMPSPVYTQPPPL